MDELKNEKTYDSVFWAAIVKLRRFIVPLINEAFGDDIPEDAAVNIKPMKMVVRQPDGTLAEIEADGMIEIIRNDNQSGLYHIECQDWGESGLAIRIAEYGVGSAYTGIKATKDGAVISLPHSAVILLRGDTLARDDYTMTVEYPGGGGSYKVPIIKVDGYGIDEISEKKLWILLPYYGFRFVKLFERLEKSSTNVTEEEKEELYSSISKINELLKDSIDDGKLSVIEKSEIADLFDRILNKLMVKIAKKGVIDSMKTQIIKTRTDEILEQGIEQGDSLRAQNVVKRMYADKLPLEKIAQYVGESIDTVKAWLSEPKTANA